MAIFNKIATEKVMPLITDLQRSDIIRGETQKDVNYFILKYVISHFNKDLLIKALDLPCGEMHFSGYLRNLFPNSDVWGADINKPSYREDVTYVKMDLTEDFSILPEQKFDLITSISGIMMFGNTLRFFTNISHRLKKNGTFIVTNDNAATIKDKLSFLFLGASPHLPDYI